ncbi:MAG TPA: hypothetical protein VGB19_10180 [Actinomycetota bacterium]
MRRMFWLAVGLGAGVAAAVMVARWTRRQTERVSPANIGRQVSGTASDLARLVREALAEGKAGMAEREAEIRREIGGPE